jgi:uncharacterized membrane protein
MLGLSILGTVHTLASLIAIACGVIALAKRNEISLGTTLGKLYGATTAITAATALGLFAHGRFGPAHMLALLTLGALAVAWMANASKVFGRASRLLHMSSMSATMLFHAIPGVTEALTRLPLGAPMLPSPEAPQFKPIYAALLLIFIVGLALQVRWLRKQGAV